MRHVVCSVAILLFASLAIEAQTAGAQTSSSDAITQQLIQLEHQKDKAFETGDKKALDHIYADDYQGITSIGTFVTKTTILDFFPRPKVFESHRSEDIAVRVFSDVAVVTGIQKRKFYKDIKAGEEDTLRYTNIYVKRLDSWQIVAAQYSSMKK